MSNKVISKELKSILFFLFDTIKFQSHLNNLMLIKKSVVDNLEYNKKCFIKKGAKN